MNNNGVAIGSNSVSIGSSGMGNSSWQVVPSQTTSGSGNLYANGSNGQLYIHPAGTTTTTGSISISGSTVLNYPGDKYYIMKLPVEEKKKMPESVYINGSLATLGMFGSDVDCAFTGKDLIFQSGILRALVFGEKIKLSIYYKRRIYHYKCRLGITGVNTLENTNIIDTELLSTIER